MNSNEQPNFNNQVPSNLDSTTYSFFTLKKCKTFEKSKFEQKAISKEIFTITKHLDKESRTFLKKNSSDYSIEDSKFLARTNKFMEETYNSNNNKRINNFSSPYNCNILAQSPFSFEKYLNSYSRDNMNVLSFLNKKKKYKKEMKLNNYINNFKQQINRGQNYCFDLTSEKHFNNYQLINSDLIFKQFDDEINNNIKNNNFLNYYKINSNLNDSKNVNLKRTVSSSDNICKLNEIPYSFFADDKFINDLSRSIDKEFSLPLSEIRYSKEENEFEIYHKLFKNEEFPAKNLNFDEEDSRLFDIIKTNILQNHNKIPIIDLKKPNNNKKIKQKKSKKNIELKINQNFKIDDFYQDSFNEERIEEENYKKNIEIKHNMIPTSFFENSNENKNTIFKCLEDCISTGVDSYKKSNDLDETIKKRIRKSDSQIQILENLIKSNDIVPKESIAEASIKTGLSTMVIYKWIWDRRNKKTKNKNEKNELELELENKIEAEDN